MSKFLSLMFILEIFFTKKYFYIWWELSEWIDTVNKRGDLGMLFCFKKSQVVFIPYHITDLYKVHISNLNPEYNLYLSVSFYSLKNKQKTHKSSPRIGQWHCRVPKYTIPKYGMRIMFELKETEKSRYKKAALLTHA